MWSVGLWWGRVGDGGEGRGGGAKLIHAMYVVNVFVCVYHRYCVYVFSCIFCVSVTVLVGVCLCFFYPVTQLT